MSEELSITIKELVERPWSEMIVYSLTEKQKEELLNNKNLVNEYIMFLKGSVWEEHSHNRSQLILVIAGKLTHIANRKEFVQEVDNLLIVPKDVIHHAYAGKSKHLLVYVFHKK